MLLRDKCTKKQRSRVFLMIEEFITVVRNWIKDRLPTKWRQRAVWALFLIILGSCACLSIATGYNVLDEGDDLTRFTWIFYLVAAPTIGVEILGIQYLCSIHWEAWDERKARLQHWQDELLGKLAQMCWCTQWKEEVPSGRAGYRKFYCQCCGKVKWQKGRTGL